MSIWTSLANYRTVRLGREGRCSFIDCNKFHPAGDAVLFRSYKNPHNRNQTARQIFCDEECWRGWEADYWEGKADEKNIDASFERKMRICTEAVKEGYRDSAGFIAEDRNAMLEEIEWQERQEEMKNYEI